MVKTAVCRALGYPIPKSFKKTQPRFPGQNFDTYVQKADNLQIWNEEVSASRRYVLIRVNDASVVTKVRVLTGDLIARLDTTGTLTHKFQAKARAPVTGSVLVSPCDTSSVVAALIAADHPQWPEFLPIQNLYQRLKRLVGKVLPDPGRDQERNRGGRLHDAVCRELGMEHWSDDGQFPDVTEQLLEIKLQTASTIDLGLVCPDDEESLADFPDIRHCDVRYAIFYGTPARNNVRIDSVVMTTGSSFFQFFRKFGGKVRNAKLQIPLPKNFFG